jgi:hypothetical protein
MLEDVDVIKFRSSLWISLSLYTLDEIKTCDIFKGQVTALPIDIFWNICTEVLRNTTALFMKSTTVNFA